MHTSQNSLDWDGTYEGTLPCADCPGMRTRLTLNGDGSYELSTLYLDRQAAPQVARGQFTWNAARNAITLDASGRGQRFSVGEGRLTLQSGDGRAPPPSAPNLVLTGVPRAAPTAASAAPALVAHRWTLESATDSQGRRIDALAPGPGRAFVVGFSDARLHIEGGCNPMTGGYRIDADGRLVVGRLAATLMACEPALMQADRSLSALLAGPLRIDLGPGTPPRLRLVSPDNEALTFTGQATPEALYGAGELIYMEVAAQRVACRNPLTGDTLCLQVRDRRYDAQGLALGPPGAWRPLYERIENYSHTAGVRNVLRIKRFQSGNSPVYVLDLVVESETVAR